MTSWGFHWICSQTEPWDELQDLVNEYESSCDCLEDSYKPSLYEEFLEDLQQMKTVVNCFRKYAQHLDDDTDIAKSIEESLSFVRNFDMLVKKWNFGKLNNIDAKIRDIYDSMASVSRDAALILQLFMAESFDGLDDAMNLRISELQEKSIGVALKAEEGYYNILSLLKLCARDSCPVKSETLYGLIDSLQKNLMEVLSDRHLVGLSRGEDITDMINEMEFLKSILRRSSDGLIDRGKLNAVSTHVNVLAWEAGSAVYASAGKIELDNRKTHTKFTSLVVKINQIKHELIQTNKKDEMAVHCSIEDFINDEYFRNGRNGCQCHKDIANVYPIILELDFYQSFFRCTKNWCIEHPRLRVIRIYTEDVVRCAGWDIRCFSFRKNIIGEEVTGEKIEFLLSGLLQKLTMYRLDVEEICAKIRDSKPSSPSRLCREFGLDFADVREEGAVCDLAILFRSLHQISGNLLTGRKSLNGMSTFFEESRFLEDLIDRAACLSFLQLVDKADKTVALKVLLDHIEEPEIVNNFKALLGCTVWNVRHCVVTRHVQMLAPVKVLIHFIGGVIRTHASVVAYMKDHIGTVLRDLTVLKCILTDPLMECYEQQEYDELLTDIGAGIAEAGVFFFVSHVHKSEGNIFFQVKDVAHCISATVRQVYLKYTKLPPPKLPTTEMGSLNILLANLKKMNNCRQIRELHEDLQVCNSFLEESDISSNQDELRMIKCLRTRISSLGCKLANALDTLEGDDKVPDWFFKKRISSFKEEVKLIIVKIKNTKLQLLADVHSPKVEAKPLKAKVIGFEDVEEQLVKQLTTGSRVLEVISIVGMPGLGKTTLAMSVYEAVAGSFHCSAWCYVSQNYQEKGKGLLLQILNEIEGPSEGIEELSNEDLALKIYQCLMKKKNYLIVLDDVWDIKTWNELRMCFPVGNDRNRILLTSRSKVVGLHASSFDDSCISLNLLSTKNSRLLLENSIFGASGFPEHLREIGVEIADRCGRLPLSLVLMAGVLKSVDKNKQEWEQVAQNLNSLVQSQDGVLSTLELSYKHLPDHLKQCFLYCGALMSTPTTIRRGEIRRSKLVQLWVAERFIDETNEHLSLDLIEKAAEGYLKDLISRSLLIISKKGTDGQTRSCRMHDLLRDFCIWKGDQEQFMLTRLDVSEHFPNLQQRLHVCFHKFLLAKPISSIPRTRSLIHSECDFSCMFINYGKVSFILKHFRLLNVLDLERANMGDTIPKSIIKMSHLRYLAICGLTNCIPSSINKLSDLETLIIKGGKDAVRIGIPDTVFGLKKLRHLTVSPHVHFNTKSLSPSDCLQLQTLETVMFCRCKACKDAINRLPNLWKLKCIFSGSIWYDGFPALDSLNCLEFVEASYSGLSPLFFNFSLPILPTNLKKITLSKFELPWSEMEKIAALPHVEYLKLQSGAFSGKKWVTQSEFPSLKYLRLESLDVEDWEASDDHFPCLERLIVRGCKRLKAIPSDFSDVVTLSFIEINQCGRSVGDSAIEIKKQQKNSGNTQFKTVLYRIEKMVFNEEQANKELYLSWGVFLAFQFVLIMTMWIRSTH